MVKVGDKYVLTVTMQNPDYEKMTGKVVWIHPENRFCRVEFIAENGRHFYECYQLVDGKFFMNKLVGHRPHEGGK